MRSRKFRKQIGVYKASAVADGYGGNTVSSELVANVWCDIKTLDRGDMTDYGLDTATLGIEVTARKPDIFDYSPENIFIKYNGEDYNIAGYTENVNFDNSIIKFVAVKER